MNKSELYNKIVDIYKKSGQGIPKFIETKIGSDVIDQLVEDGLVKIVTQKFSYLPNSEDICLTKGYCVEEDMSKGNHQSLTFMRMYMNVNPVVELGDIVLTLNDTIKDLELMKKYVIWLEKNKEKLEEIKDIEYLDEKTEIGLSNESIEYLKTRSWYKKNNIISECLSSMSSGDTEVNKQMSILTELIKLKSTPSVREKYKDSINEDITEKNELEKEMKIRSRIRNWLSSKDANEKIQSFI